jgi:hypothetical protein
MPGTIRLGALLALLAAAVALPGCGSDEISGEIPPDDATRLNKALDGVGATIETDCDQAQEYAQDFVDEVNLLPQDPSGELKGELQDAGNHLRTLVESECASTEPPTTPPATSSTASTTTTSSTEDTTTADTTTTTTDTTTTPTDETQPPGNGNGPPGGGPPGQDGGTGGTGGPGSGSDE